VQKLADLGRIDSTQLEDLLNAQPQIIWRGPGFGPEHLAGFLVNGEQVRKAPSDVDRNSKRHSSSLQIAKVITVASDPDNEIAVFLRISLGGSQRLDQNTRGKPMTLSEQGISAPAAH
jgi:hypothetical protein